MVKRLQKIGNSRGIVIDKPILDLLNIDENSAFEISTKDGGLFLKPISVKRVYKEIAKKHHDSLDKNSK